jgi:hypothetical protein
MGPLLRVSADGGEPVEVARPDRTNGDGGLRFPYFLPDGNHFLYISLPRKQRGFDVYLGALDSKETKRIGAATSAPIYVEPGYLVFVAGDRLVARRFELSSLQPTSDAVPLGEAPPTGVFEGGTALSASNAGESSGRGLQRRTEMV